MSQEEKIALLDDTLEYASFEVTDEERQRIIESPVFIWNKYFYELCVLIKMYRINLDDVLSLATVPYEDLLLYLNDDYDWLEECTPEKISQNFDYVDNSTEVDLEDDRQYYERMARIKALSQANKKKNKR